MGIDAGTVYAEIRVALDKLQHDINSADLLFTNLGKNVDKQNQQTANSTQSMAKKISTAFQNMSKNGINQFARMAQGINAAFSALPIIGLITMVIGAITKMVNGIGEWLKEGARAYKEHQQELAKMEAVLRSTGAAAWTSTRQLADHAKELGNNSQYAQNEIMKMQSVLLGFRSVTGSVFKDATQAIIDMSTVMGGDLVGTANTVGKALDSPIEGLAALSRNGFVFTQVQKEMIAELVNSGQKIEAQKIIVNEIKSAFGGAAEAVSNVTKEQARLVTETERLKRAQGEATSGWTVFWSKWRADLKAAKADLIEMQNRLKNGLKPVEEMEKQIEFINEKIRIGVDGYTRQREEINKENIQLGIKLGMQQRALDQAKEVLMFMEYNLRGHPIIALLKQKELNIVKEQIQAEQKKYDAIQEQINAHSIDAEKRLQAINDEEAEINKLNQAREKGISTEQKASEFAQTRIKAIQEAERAKKAGSIDEQQMLQNIAQAYQNEINQINALITEVGAYKVYSKAAIDEQQKLLTDLNSELTETSTEYQKLIARIKAGKNIGLTTAQLEEQMDAILETERKTLNAISSMMDNTAANDQERLDDLLQQRVSAEQQAANALQTLWKQNGITIEGNEQAWKKVQGAIDTATVAQKQYNDVLKQIKSKKDQQDAEKKALEFEAESRQEVNLLLAKQQGDLEKVRDVERQISLEKLRQESFYKNASEDTRRLLESWEQLLQKEKAALDLSDMLKDYDKKIKEIGMSSKQSLKAQRAEALNTASAFSDMGNEHTKLTDKINEYFDTLEKKEAWDKFTQNAQMALSQASQLFTAISDLLIADIKRSTDEYLLSLDRQYNGDGGLFAMLEKEKQEKLYQRGYIEAQTEEQHERELELAIESGDQQRIYAAQDAFEKFKIEENYKNKKKALEDEYAKLKAEAEYEQALAEWEMQRVQAHVNIAQAHLVAASSAPWPYNLIPLGFATAIGALQLGLIEKNKPTLTYADGGIVPGSSFRGDTVLTRQNSGEMNLNMEQQRNLFDAIKNGDLGSQDQEITINVPVYLDGALVAKSTVKYINNRQEFINRGSVI